MCMVPLPGKISNEVKKTMAAGGKWLMQHCYTFKGMVPSLTFSALTHPSTSLLPSTWCWLESSRMQVVLVTTATREGPTIVPACL
jgi:hypothetical protein